MFGGNIGPHTSGLKPTAGRDQNEAYMRDMLLDNFLLVLVFSSEAGCFVMGLI